MSMAKSGYQRIYEDNKGVLNDGKWSKVFKKYYSVGFGFVAVRRDADGEVGGRWV